MATPSINLTKQIAAPPSAVWRILTDLDGAADLLPGVKKVERLAGPAYGVGTRWRETRTMLGAAADEEMEVVAVDTERSTEIAAESHGMVYRTIFQLRPTDGGTELTMRFTGTAEPAPSLLHRVIGTLTGPLGNWITRRTMLSDLDAIAAAAEQS